MNCSICGDFINEEDKEEEFSITPCCKVLVCHIWDCISLWKSASRCIQCGELRIKDQKNE